METYKISTIVLSVVAVLFFCTTVYYATHTKVKYETMTKCDTTYLHTIDTVTVTKSDIVYKNIIVLDTIYISDTAMLVEQKVFNDSISTIYISGVNPELDSIEYRLSRDTVQIYTEKIQTMKEQESFWHNRFTISAGVFAGYGLINRQADVFVGVGCAVRLY